MKKLLLVSIVLMLAGCVAVPVYDGGYYYPYYGYYDSYPFSYAGPDVSIFYSGFYGGHGYRDGHGFYRGGDDFRGGSEGFYGGGRRGGVRR